MQRTSNADTDKEPPGSQHVEHANGIAMVVGASSQGCKDNEDSGGHQQRIVARPAIGQEAKQQLSNDSASKGNVGHVLAGVAGGVDGAVLKLKDCVDRADDVVHVAVGEETSAASEDGQSSLEEALAGSGHLNGGLHCC